MSSKATVAAPSNIAFVKYWGTRDEARTIPYNPSISMTLTHCVSTCTVEYRAEGYDADEVLLRNESGSFGAAPEDFARGVFRHLARLKEWAGVKGSFRVATQNSFPTGAGMASSASGFAALALATAAALGRQVDGAEASRLAILSGSGSAARSVLGGYVEWPPPNDTAAWQIAPPEHWDLRDVVAVVDSSPKEISSREGHRRAPTSPYWDRRLEALPERLESVRRALAEREFDALGAVLEEEAVDLHLIAMSSRPPIFYWTAGTLEVLRRVRELREEGVAAYATIDAGPNVHLIAKPDAERRLVSALEDSAYVQSVIVDRVGAGPRTLTEHLV
ncbi:MAG: diphosphomevalonate decarboxylase [Acidobacteriota bacterium]|nr:diphosphomevalonate decarboxylase [Acidobacteriota bacterium]